MSETVDSAGDARVVNNSMRHHYRVLDEREKADMVRVKDAGLAFVQLLHEIGSTTRPSVPYLPGSQVGSRDLALANTHIEDAVMRAVRHITG